MMGRAKAAGAPPGGFMFGVAVYVRKRYEL